MEQIQFGKKYLISCYDYKSEAIYIGIRLKKNLKNKHLFMVWHSSMKSGEKPEIIGCEDFKIREENKLEVISLHFPKINKKEEKYLTELAKKYW